MTECKFCRHIYVETCDFERSQACTNFPRGEPMTRLIGTHTILKTFDLCPKQMFHRYVAKDQPFVPTEAMTWGTRVHEALDLRVSKKTPLPEGMTAFEKYAVPFDTHAHVRTELKKGMNLKGEGRAFFDKEGVQYRSVIDVVSGTRESAFILDWKTGRKWEDPKELQEHAVLLKIENPQLTTIKGAYCWLKDDQLGKVYDLHATIPETFERIVDTVSTINQMIEKGTEFPARENKLCGWCSVTTCSYNPRRA